MKALKIAVVTAALVLSCSANAALVERLGGLAYYDDVADLTWLADANAARGIMNWADANNWVVGLTVESVDGWRLPDTLHPDASCSVQTDLAFGYNCTGSEMGNMFYNVLGGSAGSSITTTHNGNYDLFSNILSSWYWSTAPLDSNDASIFIMSDGFQLGDNKSMLHYSWAVQSGDVSVVPVPAAVWLFGSGLIGVARSKKA